MKFNFLKNNDIDKNRWNQAIENSRLPMVYAQSWFLDIVSPNWTALVAGDYDMVMPIPQRSKMMVPVVVQPMFAQQLGIFSNSEVSIKEISTAMTFLMRRYPFVAYQFNRANDAILGHKYIQVRNTYELKLDSSYSQLLKNISRSHKKNLDKSFSEGITITRNGQPDTFVNMLVEMYTSIGISVVKPVHYQNLLHIAQYAITNTNSLIYEAFSSEGNRIGSAFFLRSGKQVVLFTARTTEGVEKRSTFSLINQLLVDLSGTDCYLDFAGSDMKGIAEFNAGWGSQNYQYPILKNQWLPFKD